MKLHFSYSNSVYQKQKSAFCFQFRCQLHPQMLFYHQTVPACFRLASEPLILLEVSAAHKWEQPSLGGVSADSSFTRASLRLAASDLSAWEQSPVPQHHHSLTLPSKEIQQTMREAKCDGLRLFLTYLSTLLHSLLSSLHCFSYK